MFPCIFSYCQIKTPLSLLKNSLSCLKDLCQLSGKSHTTCPSGSEGISCPQIYPFTLLTAKEFECSKHCRTHEESSFSRCLHKKKKSWFTDWVQATCTSSKYAGYMHADCISASQLQSQILSEVIM